MMVRNTKYKVEFAENALNMLKYHAQYISLFNPKKAIEFKNKVIAKAKELEIFPNRNPTINLGFKDNYRKMIIDSKYILIYRVIDNIVHIDYFADCRQKNRWLLSK